MDYETNATLAIVAYSPGNDYWVEWVPYRVGEGFLLGNSVVKVPEGWRSERFAAIEENKDDVGKSGMTLLPVPEEGADDECLYFREANSELKKLLEEDTGDSVLLDPDTLEKAGLTEEYWLDSWFWDWKD